MVTPRKPQREHSITWIDISSQSPPGDECKACSDDFVVLSTARRGPEGLYPLRGDDLVVFAHIAKRLIFGSRYRLWIRVRPASGSGRSAADADLLLEQRRH